MVFLGLLFQVGFDWKKEPELKARHIGVALIGLIGLIVAAVSAQKQSRESNASAKELTTCNSTITEANTKITEANTKITQLSEAVRTGEDDARTNADAQRKQLVELGERLGTIKGEATSQRERAQIESLEKQLAIANTPKPMAALIPSFPVQDRVDIPKTIETAPFQATVPVSLMVYNPTDVLAINGRVLVQLPDGFTFSHEKAGLNSAGVPNQREYLFQRLDGEVALQSITFDVNVPVHTGGFAIGIKSTCDNCKRSKDYMDYLQIHWDPTAQL